MSKSHELFNFIWSIADLLRRPHQPQYEHVMLQLVVSLRFDCVFKLPKQAVLEKLRRKLAHQATTEAEILRPLCEVTAEANGQ
jgi:type I restriction-modification system DNA methylase subunit